MTRAAARLPEALGEVFSLTEARRLGVSRARLRRSDVESPFRGVYRRTPGPGGDPDSGRPHALAAWRLDHRRRAQALSRLMEANTWFFRGRTAAVLWGLPIPYCDDDPVEVGVHAPARPPNRRGVRGAQVRPEFARLCLLNGLRVTSPASTWAALGDRLATRDLVACGDAVVHQPRIPGGARLKRAPLAMVDDLSAHVEAGRRRGIVRLREALPLIRTGSASPPETHLRLLIAESALPEPVLDFDVRDRWGRLLGCSELAFPEYRVAVEYESEHHRVDRVQWNRDIGKYQEYAEAGWAVVRATATLLYRQEPELRRRLHSALARAGWRRAA